jgi:hypothetical protein
MTNAINRFKLMSEYEFDLMRNNSFRFLENTFQVHDSYKKIINSVSCEVKYALVLKT